MNENANPNTIPTPKGDYGVYPEYQPCGCGQDSYLNTFQQSVNNQNMMHQPLQMQSLPLFLQQPSQSVMQQQMQQPQADRMMMQPIMMDQSSPAVMPQTTPMFTNSEQLSMLNNTLPVTAESIQFLNGFLRTQIGRRVKIEFLIGTSSFLDKEGILLGVGVNYLLINETETDDITACDFYSIKFIKFYY